MAAPASDQLGHIAATRAAEMRRVDVSRNGRFKGIYRTSAMWALILFMLYPYLTPRWRAVRAVETSRESSLAELKRYLASSRLIAMLRKGDRTRLDRSGNGTTTNGIPIGHGGVMRYSQPSSSPKSASPSASTATLLRDTGAQRCIGHWIISPKARLTGQTCEPDA